MPRMKGLVPLAFSATMYCKFFLNWARAVVCSVVLLYLRPRLDCEQSPEGQALPMLPAGSASPGPC
jgi:hypothetical protein